MNVRRINQQQRRDLLVRISNGEREAVPQLANLYEQAGYPTLAKYIRQGEGSEAAWQSVLRMARTFLADAQN